MSTNFSEENGSMMNELRIVNKPDILSYSLGDKIKYDGITLYFNGRDVTDDVNFSVEQDSVWSKDFGNSIEVDITYNEDNIEYHTSITLKKKRSKVLFIILSLVALLAIIGGVLSYTIIKYNQPPDDVEAGSFVLPQGDMSDEEAKEMLNKQVEESRITVSVSPKMRLRDNGDLRVNFIVAEQNNGLSERLEVIQDGQVVYKTRVVEPGYMIEWGSQSTAKLGPATATIYAVNPDTGGDSGNPVSVEIEIIEDEE